jgi:lipoprotein-anchoring transpeptidase ErfK/SrfK
MKPLLIACLLFAFLTQAATAFPLKIFKTQDQYSEEMLMAIEKINGLDRRYFPNKKILIPNSLSEFNAYLPIDQQKLNLTKDNQAIIVNRQTNILGVYESGRLICWMPITRGRKIHWTPAGDYQIQAKWRRIISTKYGGVSMPYALHIVGNVCIHQGPMVGHPASHGCVRLFKRDAAWLYSWAKKGTRVIIE